MGTFLIECYWPGIQTNAATSMELVARLADGKEPTCSVRWLGSILLPSDGLVLFVLQAQTEADVKAYAEIAEMPFDRVTEAICLAPDA
jgi:hypothetical protein